MMETANLTAHFLIAMPGLGDPNFFRTVTFLCKHSPEGALGIVINRQSNMELGELLQQMEIETSRDEIKHTALFYGGPVQPERGFVIHEPLGEWDSTLPVTDTIGLTTSKDILEAIAADRGPAHYLIALGYAGWGEGQLENELIDNAWLSAPAENSVLFDTPVTQRWKRAAEHMGVDLDLLSSETGHG